MCYTAVDFDEFHQKELPKRLREGISERIIWDVTAVAPIAITLSDGRAYSYVVEQSNVSVIKGVVENAGTVVIIKSEEAWIDYLYEMRTRCLLYTSDAADE